MTDRTVEEVALYLSVELQLQIHTFAAAELAIVFDDRTHDPSGATAPEFINYMKFLIAPFPMQSA